MSNNSKASMTSHAGGKIFSPVHVPVQSVVHIVNYQLYIIACLLTCKIQAGVVGDWHSKRWLEYSSGHKHKHLVCQSSIAGICCYIITSKLFHVSVDTPQINETNQATISLAENQSTLYFHFVH